jgi:hypothetical protein
MIWIPGTFLLLHFASARSPFLSDPVVTFPSRFQVHQNFFNHLHEDPMEAFPELGHILSYHAQQVAACDTWRDCYETGLASYGANEMLSLAYMIKATRLDPTLPGPYGRLGLSFRTKNSFSIAFDMQMRELGLSRNRPEVSHNRHALAAATNLISGTLALHLSIATVQIVLRETIPLRKKHVLVGVMQCSSTKTHLLWSIDFDVDRVHMEHAMAYTAARRECAPSSSLTCVPQNRTGLSSDDPLMNVQIDLSTARSLYELYYAGCSRSFAMRLTKMLSQVNMALGETGIRMLAPYELQAPVIRCIGGCQQAKTWRWATLLTRRAQSNPNVKSVRRRRNQTPPRIRVAFVSSDLRRHSVGFSMLGLLVSQDYSRVMPVCYLTSNVDPAPAGRPTDPWRSEAIPTSTSQPYHPNVVGLNFTDLNGFRGIAKWGGRESGPCNPLKACTREQRVTEALRRLGSKNYTYPQMLFHGCQGSFAFGGTYHNDNYVVGFHYDTKQYWSLLANHIDNVTQPHIVVDLNGRTKGHAGSTYEKLSGSWDGVVINYLGSPSSNFEPSTTQFLMTDPYVSPPDMLHEIRRQSATTTNSDTKNVTTGNEVWPIYSEAVIYLPPVYHALALDFLRPTKIIQRKREELSATATVARSKSCDAPMVFAAFHNAAKLEPRIFTAWLNVLQRADACSVLWLLKPKGQAHLEDVLLAEIVARGIHPGRVIFKGLANGFDNRETVLHLYNQVHVFLDTQIYGYHSTAADIMRTGAALLTLVSDAWPGRVAYNFQRAADDDSATTVTPLPLARHLAMSSVSEYENAGVVLGKQWRLRCMLRHASLHKFNKIESHLLANIIDPSVRVRHTQKGYSAVSEWRLLRRQMSMPYTVGWPMGVNEKQFPADARKRLTTAAMHVADDMQIVISP